MNRQLWPMVILLGLAGFGLIAGPATRQPVGDPVASEPSAGHRDDQYDSYSRFVRRYFIDTTPGGNALLRVGGPEQPIVILDPNASEAARAFVESSYLQRDLNANDAAIWKIENGKVVDIVPNRYQDVLPSVLHRSWAGAVLYRPVTDPADLDRSAVIAGAQQRVIHLDSADPNRPGIDLKFTVAAPGDAGVGNYYVDTNGVAVVAAERVDLHCDKSGTASARLIRVGDQIAIRHYPGGCGVSLGSTKLDGDILVAVPRSTLLAISDRSGQPVYSFVYPRWTDTPLISTPTRAGTRRQSPEIRTWAAAVDRDYDRALMSRRADQDNQGVIETPLETSLDARLQSALQAQLRQFIANLPNLPRGRPIVATATVMDALRGDVLAMASIDETPRRPVAGTDVDVNLLPLPIGSAAKPIFATAILSAKPELASLCVRVKATQPLPGEKEGFATDFLGHTLVGEPQKTAGGDIDFDTFISKSNNGYMAALLLLASSNGGEVKPEELVWVQEGEGYGLAKGTCNTLKNRKPSIYDPSHVLKPGSMDISLQDTPPQWVDRLAQIFDANVNSPGMNIWGVETETPFRACHTRSTLASADLWGGAAIDASPWRGAFGESGEKANPCAFDASTLRREALGLTGRRHFQSDILSAALGGGEGKWSTVKLAEAYARIVTGRHVQARFTPSKAGSEIAPLIADAAYPLEIRQRMTAAMRRVTQDGTAVSIHPQMQQVAALLADHGLVFSQFAKTGTPTLVNARLSAAELGLNQLIASGCLNFDPDATAVVPRANDPCWRNSTSSMRKLLKQLNDGQKQLPEQLQPSSTTEGRNQYFEFSNGILVRVKPRNFVYGPTREGAVFVIVVAASRREENRSFENDVAVVPTIAYSLAINFTFRRGNHNDAADFAAMVTRDILAPSMIKNSPISHAATAIVAGIQ